MKQGYLGILTGGGDVPGLNSVIKSVVYRTAQMGIPVLGIKKGWEGLTHLRINGENDDQYIKYLTPSNTRVIDRTGGTILHTSRTNPLYMPKTNLPSHLLRSELQSLQNGDDSYDFTSIVLRNLQRLKINTLISIGGDDTLSYSAHLEKEGFPLIAIPKTMDNDVQNTEYCIGFSTAITRAKELITRQRTTLGSHERIGVFRIFGRDAGFTAFYTGYVTSSRCLIPEYIFDLDHLVQLMVQDKENNPSSYSLVVVSEGATWKGREVLKYGDADSYGHRKKKNVGETLATEIRKKTGISTMASDLTYDLRSGDPDSLDRLVSTTFANIAVDLLNDGVSGRMVGIKNGRYASLRIPESSVGPRKLDVELIYNKQKYRPNYSGRLGSPILLY